MPTRRFPVRPALDAQIDAAFLRGGYFEARQVAIDALGWEPDNTQIDIAIGRHAWLLGERRGAQGYQLRMARRGQAMPSIDPEGVGTEQVNPTEGTGNYFASIERRFGIEIEFEGGRWNHAAMVNEMRAAGYQAHAENYNHDTRTYWKMTTDATVTGGEFVSPILSGVDGHNQTRAALRAVRNNGGRPGQGQGMHVHHDVMDHSSEHLTRLLLNLSHCQDALLAYVPHYRWNGSGTHRANRISPTAWGQYINDAASDRLTPNRWASRQHYGRYVAFNMNAVATYGTIEFRALGNTLNAVKIKTWVRIGQALIAWSLDGHEFAQDVTSQELVDELVRERYLPAREGERFMAIVTSRMVVA